ncbi:MAG: FkbM family methyltransferase [Acidimicrobiales bacterium]
MRLTVRSDDGGLIEFECPDSVASRWTNVPILEGRTYPFLAFVDDVGIVFDVGANCGAASVHFARHHPAAQVHAFEPGWEARSYLERNVASLPNVCVHPFGLSSADREARLYHGDDDLGKASLIPRKVNLDESEPVELRAGGTWAAEQGIQRIDILKVDVEGCEVEVLEGLGDLLPTVKLLFVEYDSRRARKALGRLLDPTHELYIGKQFLDQGECVYLRADVAGLDAATELLRDAFAAALARPVP